MVSEKNNFLETRNIFLLRKFSLVDVKKVSLVLRYVLNSSQSFLQKGQEKFSQLVYFS